MAFLLVCVSVFVPTSIHSILFFFCLLLLFLFPPLYHMNTKVSIMLTRNCASLKGTHSSNSLYANGGGSRRPIVLPQLPIKQTVYTTVNRGWQPPKGDMGSLSSDGMESSSSDTDEISPLPATLVPHRVGRSIGSVVQDEYTIVEGEEETESESSLENSGEYEPLGFFVIAGNRPAIPCKQRETYYHTDECEDSEDELSLLEAPLAVGVQSSRRHSTQCPPTKGELEAVELQSMVEVEESVELPLNAALINGLITRLRNPEEHVAASDFDQLDWDDPRFEKELLALRDVVSFIEVKEAILKKAKGDILKPSANIDMKVREAIEMLPPVVMEKMRYTSERQGTSAAAVKREYGESLALRGLPEDCATARGDQSIRDVNPRVLKANDGEGRVSALTVGKHLNSSALLVAASDAVPVRESFMCSSRVGKKKKRDGMLTSQSLVDPLPKESVFAEDASRRHRRHRKEASHLSLTIDRVEDEVPGEIVEEEYANVEVPQEDANKKGVNEEGKVNHKVLRSKKARRSSQHMQLSAILTSEGFEQIIAEEYNVAPRTHDAHRLGNGRHRAKKSCQRSISFVEVQSVASNDIMEDDIALRSSRACRRDSGVSLREGERSMLWNIEDLEGQPSAHTEVDKKIRADKSGKKPRSGSKKRAMRTSGLHRSREIDFSYIPDEMASEISDPENEKRLLSRVSNAALSHAQRRLSECHQPLWKRRMSDQSAFLSSLSNTASRRRSFSRSERSAAQSRRFTELPDLEAIEIPDHVEVHGLGKRLSKAGSTEGGEFRELCKPGI